MNRQHRNADESGIRKAAILVASLDRRCADAVLEALGDEQAGRVRQAMVEMEQIDSHQQHAVIEEFLRVRPMMPEDHPPGLELDDRLARKLSPPHTGDAPEPLLSSLPPDQMPFRFLHDAESDRLARVLCGERPQAVALVLSHLPPEQAAGVLVRLPGAIQAEVIRRLADLEEADPQVLRDVERVLESRLSQQVHMQRRRVAGMKAIAEILAASEGRVGMQILDNLAAHDRPLADRLSPPPLEFDDLARLDESLLGEVFPATQPELVMTALVGAPPKLIDRILHRFPTEEAETLRRKLNCPGPILLRDVEAARQEIIHRAGRLHMEGRITLPPREAMQV